MLPRSDLKLIALVQPRHNGFCPERKYVGFPELFRPFFHRCPQFITLGKVEMKAKAGISIAVFGKALTQAVLFRLPFR